MRWNANNYEIDRGKGQANGRAGNKGSPFPPVCEAYGPSKKKTQQGGNECALNRRLLKKSVFYLALPGIVTPTLEIRLPDHIFYCMSYVGAFV